METKVQGQGLPPTLLVSHWIGGCTSARLGRDVSRLNPVDRSDVVTQLPGGDSEDIARAVGVAQSCWVDWSSRPPSHRSAVIKRWIELLLRRTAGLSRFVARELGQPAHEAAADLHALAATTELVLAQTQTEAGRVLSSQDPNVRLLWCRKEHGAVAVVGLPGYGLLESLRRVVTALAWGNTVLWCPRPEVGATSTLVATLGQAAGLPQGTLNVVHGVWRCEDVDTLLVEQRLETPESESHQVGANPCIVLADADLMRAVTATVRAAFSRGGQAPTSCRNVIVDRRVASVFLEQLARVVRALRVGSPVREDVDLGALASEELLGQFLEQRAMGIEDGAELVVDGRRLAGAHSGSDPLRSASLLVTPRLFAGVHAAMRIAFRPCLGPTVNVIDVEGPVEAFDKAFAVPPGRCCTLFTRDARAMLTLQRRAPTATVRVNPTSAVEDDHGVLGPAWAAADSEACTRWQAVELAGEPEQEDSAVELPPAGGTPTWLDEVLAVDR
jgi:acyl-CoA reductase-like NAD-dependent aldehyde dehydrogenase